MTLRENDLLYNELSYHKVIQQLLQKVMSIYSKFNHCRNLSGHQDLSLSGFNLSGPHALRQLHSL